MFGYPNPIQIQMDLDWIFVGLVWIWIGLEFLALDLDLDWILILKNSNISPNIFLFKTLFVIILYSGYGVKVKKSLGSDRAWIGSVHGPMWAKFLKIQKTSTPKKTSETSSTYK